MKASAIALFVLGVVGIVVAPVGAAVMRFSPFLSGQKPKAINAQSIKGVQTEGLHTNDVIHQVWDSSLVPHGTIVSTEIYWLDNSTLLFAADKDPKPAAGTNPIRVPWLFLWRLGEKPQPVGEDPQEATHFYRAAGGIACFQQKKIAPTTGQTAKVLMKGPPGEERETPPWKWLTVQHDGVPSNGEGGVAIEDIDCGQWPDGYTKPIRIVAIT